jgi:peptidoglycan hydrolase-like protein with peptidoglycan-binding domain
MRWLLWALAGVLSLLAVAAVVILLWSGASLNGDATALARISVQPFGGSVASVEAFGAGGRRIPVAVQDGRLTPLRRLMPGEQVSVTVQVRRPGWLSWALGSERTEHLTLRAPVAYVKQRWLTVPPGAPVRVGFDQSVSAVARGTSKLSRARPLAHAQSAISLGRRPVTGAVQIAVAPRSWETVGAPTQVSWFPPSHSPVMVTLPAAGSSVGPATKLYLTFSKPVDEVLGHRRPQLSPATPGHWHKANSHALVFVPSGMGAAFGSHLRVQLPHSVSVTAGGGGAAGTSGASGAGPGASGSPGSGHGASGGALRTTSEVEWTVPPGSMLRLQQLLAQAGYLPLRWHASGKDVARTPSAEAQAAVDTPDGDFSWRYGNTPHQLQALWSAGHENTITRGALMKFEDENGLTVDGLPGAAVWHKLIENAIAGKRLKSGYSYVYVHRAVPQTLTLWHNGHTVLNAPANTGISGAETEPGTFPVFEHLPETTMSGTNPDGSHYEDPGIKWVSYFNGGDALHNFDRASFGTPQSLGCVELPLAASAQIYPYTPIGTLVTIES